MESVGRLMINLDFYKGKKVFITGHIGFKGTWLCEILTKAGAIVTGYSINLPTNPSLFELSNMEEKIESITGDIRNLETLEKAFNEAKPEIVFHLAAQPLVIESYKNPVYTYETNVMGTVNILECIRKSNTVKSFVNITTDKVYKNNEWERGYKEDDVLNGYDPYSNSKSCSEIITHSYNNSFFKEKNINTSTARAGNVIGGGDFAKDRIVPDCVRACINNEDIIIRNPNSIRPYQHVLEPLYMYLTIIKKQYENSEYAGYYNVGPDDEDCITTKTLVDIFCSHYNKITNNNIKWINKSDNGPHEATFLKLNNKKIKDVFGWRPTWNIKEAIEKTVEWTNAYINNEDMKEYTSNQIDEYQRRNHYI